jgi:hypothetical protein
METINIQTLFKNEMSKINHNPKVQSPISNNTLDKVKDNDVIMLIGKTDEQAGKTCIISYSNDKAVICERNKAKDELITWSYDFTQKTLSKNKKKIFNNPEKKLIKIIRDFKQRNQKNIQVYKQKKLSN